MGNSKDFWADVDSANLFNFISNFGKNAQRDSLLEAVSALPLKQRITFFWNDQSYLKYVQTFEKNFSTLLKKKILRIVMPEVSENNKLTFNDITMDYNDKEQVRVYAVRQFFKDFFKKEQPIMAEKFFDSKAVFSPEERKIMSMFVTLLKDQTESIWTAFTPPRNADSKHDDHKKLGIIHFLEKDLVDCADVIGKAMSKDAKTILDHGNDAMDKAQNEATKTNIDIWVAKWLNPEQLSETNIQNLLMQYLDKTSDTSISVFGTVLPRIHKMPAELQTKMWDILFNKLQRNPDLTNDVSKCIQQFIDSQKFLNQKDAANNLHVFYNKFHNLVPAEIRAEILGKFPTKSQKTYWNILYSKAENHEKLAEEKIQTREGEAFLGWHLLQQGDLSSEQMVKILEKLDPIKHFNFFFSIKKSLNDNVFTKIADRFTSSTADCWRWVHSFQTTPGFESRLAQIYPDFSDRIRGNKEFVELLNKNCDLVYHLACKGNTSALSQIKKKLEPDDFWKSLTKEHKDHTSGLSALCHSGKRGLFDLIENLPVGKQRELFQRKNSQGKSALDECRGEFLTMVQQRVFDQAGENIMQQPQQGAILTGQPIQTASVQKSEKALYPRQKMLLRGALKELIDIQETNANLYDDVQGFIDNLVTMSGTRLRDTLQNDLEKRGSFANNPIGVHTIHNYHVGYKVTGDADKNEGKCVILFVWPHEKWKKDLWNAGPSLADKASTMIKTSPQHPNTGNGAESR